MKKLEVERLDAARSQGVPWRKWGPYLSERQWGTVREDYSTDGNAWAYFGHDQSRSRAYRWGEDGLAGFSDEKQRLCFALALWNGADPILKERLFGLTNSQGNHGEDVKEIYYYLDSTPTHSYMKYLYKYPHAAYPYADLVETNARRGRNELEYELIDTGVFSEDRYHDVFVEYAKTSPEDVSIRIEVHNRGPEEATLHVLPSLWFRNTWSWSEGTPKPVLRAIDGYRGTHCIEAEHVDLGKRYLHVEGAKDLLFTENETNEALLFGTPNRSPYVKDGIDECVVRGQAAAVNPERVGTKSASWHALRIPAGGSEVVRLRLTTGAPSVFSAAGTSPFEGFDALFRTRLAECDQFYEDITPDNCPADEARVMRQALAGMLWSKQYYYFDLQRWLTEHGAGNVDHLRSTVRNKEWFHMVNDDVISMPDKWEYPWYAAWDLAFHCGALAMVDMDFAKEQLDLMLREVYLHPTGQIPAYEWNFGDVNPPVHAWATLFVYQFEKSLRGKGDRVFLAQAFQKLSLNFTWWVNRKDRNGNNVFEGGFLGLDNIGIFDRSSPLPTGGHLEQADGTAWMCFFAECMAEIAIELADEDAAYEPMVVKFIEHFLFIVNAMDRVGDHRDEMWDEQDGFFYDVLRLPDGSAQRLKVRSMVGLLPLCSAAIITEGMRDRYPHLVQRLTKRLDSMPGLKQTVTTLGKPRHAGNGLLSVLDERKLRRVLERMLDENEFLSPYGIRSLSRVHADHPYVLHVGGQEYRVDYLPAESNTGMFGGNSNWRGPIWMPVNLMILRALLNYYAYYGDDFRIECPTGSGKMMTLFEVTTELSKRLVSIFTRGADGNRPVFGGARKYQEDPHFRDYLLFYEYFHGDLGAGLGASHQTGWTGTIARIIQTITHLESEHVLADPKSAALPYHEKD
ncbi:MAG: glucosidase [Polyangiales bacterium]